MTGHQRISTMKSEWDSNSVIERLKTGKPSALCQVWTSSAFSKPGYDMDYLAFAIITTIYLFTMIITTLIRTLQKVPLLSTFDGQIHPWPWYDLWPLTQGLASAEQEISPYFPLRCGWFSLFQLRVIYLYFIQVLKNCDWHSRLWTYIWEQSTA